MSASLISWFSPAGGIAFLPPSGAIPEAPLAAEPLGAAVIWAVICTLAAAGFLLWASRELRDSQRRWGVFEDRRHPQPGHA